MIELNQKELEIKRFEQKEHFAVFLYTPLCGTCKVSERMLEVVLKMTPSFPLYKCNINVMPNIAQAWRIESIPSLVILENGVPKEKIYAFKSVVYLYQKLQTLMENK